VGEFWLTALPWVVLIFLKHPGSHATGIFFFCVFPPLVFPAPRVGGVHTRLFCTSPEQLPLVDQVFGGLISPRRAHPPSPSCPSSLPPPPPTNYALWSARHAMSRKYPRRFYLPLSSFLILERFLSCIPVCQDPRPLYKNDPNFNLIVSERVPFFLFLMRHIGARVTVFLPTGVFPSSRSLFCPIHVGVLPSPFFFNKKINLQRVRWVSVFLSQDVSLFLIR